MGSDEDGLMDRTEVIACIVLAVVGILTGWIVLTAAALGYLMKGLLA